MRSLYSLAALPLSFLSGTSFAAAQTVTAPAAPSNLTVKGVGVNSFKMAWKDNSDNETGWEILVAVKGSKQGSKPTRYILLPGANLTSYVLSTINNELPGKDLLFQVRAYNGVAGQEKFSKRTSEVSAKALSPSTFGAPTKLVAKTVDDGQIKLSWKDNSTSENGYSMEYRKKGDKTWSSLGNVKPDSKFNLPSYGFTPTTSYQFRLRAYKGNPVVATAYSNVATTKTKKFQAPTTLSAKAVADGAFTFKWKDNSSAEEGYELMYRTGTGDFTSKGTVAANTESTTPVSGFSLNTTYQFKIRGFRTQDAKRVYTSYTNVVTLKSTTLTKPSAVVATAVDDYSIKVDWKDETTVESGYKVEYRKVGATTFAEGGTAAANAKTLTVGKLVPGTDYEFKIHAYKADFFGNVTATSASVSTQSRTKDGIAGDLTPPIFYGTSFSYTVTPSRLSELATLDVTGVPAGLTYNATNRTISGTISEDVIKTITVAATFNNSPAVTRNIVLRVVRPPAPPVTTAAFTTVNVAAAATQVVSVTGKFADPDTQNAARFETSKGTFDVILYSTATPLTVANFIKYIDASRYDDTFFHRSIDKPQLNLSILQGGGYKYTSATGFAAVTKYAAVNNEPGASNLKGSVAMAKLPSDQNSATSEFFVNMKDVNAENLDNSNGGFTVFGRVPDDGMDVIESIHELPVKGYAVPGLGSSAFTDMPMNAATAPKELETDKLVKITEAYGAPILTYTVTSDNTGIATATVNGTNVTITGVAAGSTNIEVKATDLDGNSITQDIPVTVP